MFPDKNVQWFKVESKIQMARGKPCRSILLSEKEWKTKRHSFESNWRAWETCSRLGEANTFSFAFPNLLNMNDGSAFALTIPSACRLLATKSSCLHLAINWLHATQTKSAVKFLTVQWLWKDTTKRYNGRQIILNPLTLKSSQESFNLTLEQAMKQIFLGHKKLADSLHVLPMKLPEEQHLLALLTLWLPSLSDRHNCRTGRQFQCYSEHLYSQ